MGCGSRQPPTATPEAPADPDDPAVSDESPAPEKPGDDGGKSNGGEKLIELEPLKIQVVTDESGEKRLIHYDPRMLLDEGNEAMMAGRFDRSLERYDKLVAEFPNSELVVPALYNAGLAHEHKGEFDAAIARYREVIKRQPTGRDSVDARIRIGIVFSTLKRWGDAQKVFEELLQHADLIPAEQIECKVRLGHVLVEQKIYDRAEAALEEAIKYYEAVTKTAHLDTNYFVAMGNYYLGNIPHRQASAIELRVMGPAGDKQLRKDIVQKRKLIKIAFDRYLIALRRRNAYWATASGYQMSRMFGEFWEDLVLAPIPPHIDAEVAPYYVKEVHKQARKYLIEALHGHTKTVELAEAYKTSTVWSKASRARATEISEILARESAGELVIPPVRTDEIPGPGQGERVETTAAYVPGRVEL